MLKKQLQPLKSSNAYPLLRQHESICLTRAVGITSWRRYFKRSIFMNFGTISNRREDILAEIDKRINANSGEEIDLETLKKIAMMQYCCRVAKFASAGLFGLGSLSWVLFDTRVYSFRAVVISSVAGYLAHNGAIILENGKDIASRPVKYKTDGKWNITEITKKLKKGTAYVESAIDFAAPLFFK